MIVAGPYQYPLSLSLSGLGKPNSLNSERFSRGCGNQSPLTMCMVVFSSLGDDQAKVTLKV